MVQWWQMLQIGYCIRNAIRKRDHARWCIDDRDECDKSVMLGDEDRLDATNRTYIRRPFVQLGTCLLNSSSS